MPADSAPSPDEQLWSEIIALSDLKPTTQPYAEWFTQSTHTRATLIEKLVLYQMLYPGGPHRAAAVRREMQTRFEWATLQGGDYQPLRNRIAEILGDATASSKCRAEAAYWDIICRRATRKTRQTTTSTVPPASQPASALDSALLAAYREYIERYPKSEYTPALAYELFAYASAANHPSELRNIVTALQQNFPHHAITQALTAALRRIDQIGRPFWLAQEQQDKPAIDTRAWLGNVVLIVVWSGQTPSSLDMLRAVEAFRTTHAHVRVVGICIDLAQAAETALPPEIRPEWPEIQDGLGLAGAFVRTWGIDRAPCVLVIDTDGNLAGCRFDDSWKTVAERALQRLPSSTTQPAN